MSCLDLLILYLLKAKLCQFWFLRSHGSIFTIGPKLLFLEAFGRNLCLRLWFLWQNQGREDSPPSSYFIFKRIMLGSYRSALFTFCFFDEEPEIQGGYAVFPKGLILHLCIYSGNYCSSFKCWSKVTKNIV